MLLPPPAQVPEVTPASILAESTVANLAAPKGFVSGQSSSYDRRSKVPGTPDWFANEDWGKNLREETNEGRKEFVMADLKGPGALVRQWTPDTVVGTWRYYFDGEATPRLVTTGREIAAGRWLGFGEPHAYVASRGCNLYYPLTYAKGLKVTVDASDGDPSRMYYILGHRSYPVGTAVRTSTAPVYPLQPPKSRLPGGIRLTGGPEPALMYSIFRDNPLLTIPAGRAHEVVSQTGKGLYTGVAFQLEPTQLPVGAGWRHPVQRHNILRHLVLEAEFDGEPCLSVPLSDLIGDLSGARFATSVSRTNEFGVSSFSLPMPFQRSCRMRLRNMGKVPVRLRFEPHLGSRDDAGDALLLHAQYRRHPGPSRPYRDLPVAHLRGRGHYVGTVLHVANPSTAWWGEGDEKIRVDGEAFPSHFGTGTEDYFGYAWSSNQPFSRPYHAQPSAGSRGNSGHIANVRWHVLDPIPYTRSLNFDLEQWHWAETKSHFATTAFWYAAPGGTPATPLRASDLTVPEIVAPKPEPGALQGEALPVERTGGTTEVQSGFEELADAQLWWRDAAEGDRLTLTLPPTRPGRYRVEMRACFARDYGRHEITLNGRSLGARDFYAPKLAWRRLKLGTVEIGSDAARLELRALRPNPKADPRRMFGLDWIRLVRVR